MRLTTIPWKIAATIAVATAAALATAGQAAATPHGAAPAVIQTDPQEKYNLSDGTRYTFCGNTAGWYAGAQFWGFDKRGQYVKFIVSYYVDSPQQTTFHGENYGSGKGLVANIIWSC